MSWHHGGFAESHLDLTPKPDGTERGLGGLPPGRSWPPVSVRPAAAFCGYATCEWSGVWADEAGAAGLVLAHYAREHAAES